MDAEDTLSTAIVSTAGFTGPIDIALCTYSSGLPQPVASDFVITVTDQSRPDFSPANATVTVRFAGISAASFSGPMTIATCTFLAPGAPPSPGERRTPVAVQVRDQALEFAAQSRQRRLADIEVLL